MAVLRSKRQIAKTEFENTFARLYQYSKQRMADIPKRKQKWLCKEIYNTLNLLYREIVEINDYYHPDKAQKIKHINQVTESAIEHLYSLEKPLMVLWSVQRTETDKMGAWVELINRDIFLLNQIHEYKGRTGGVTILDWRAINSVNFLQNMVDLHRYTHSKVANAKMEFDDTEGALLVRVIDDALYYVVQANRKIPTTRKQYEERRENISKAIMCLKEMNRHLLSYFVLMQYSERIMNEWTLLLTQELKLLYAIQRSDKKRFGNLT